MTALRIMKKILIIDDEYAILELLNVLLRDFGYEVMTASGGREGIALMHRAPPDLVILDFMMPIMNGADVLEEMRSDATLRDIPVIMVSAAPRAVAEANLPFQAFLSKPFEVAELMRTIDRLLPD